MTQLDLSGRKPRIGEIADKVRIRQTTAKLRAALGPTEAEITRAVMEHWRARGVAGSLVASIPNMGARGQYGLTKGLPDLMVITKGRGVSFVELKRDGGKLRPEQKTFADTCAANGVGCFVAYGLDEALTVLEQLGALRRTA